MSEHGINDLQNVIYHRPDIMVDRATHFCPGCGHGITQRLVGEVLDELDLKERAICIGSIGCTVTAYEYFKVDGMEAPHGRAPAVATAIKRCHPELVPFAIQGDGDLASIGMAEIVHAAARGENITIIFANNANYGMTGGQLAPTTLMGMYTSSTVKGRKQEHHGFPIRVSEMLATLDGPAYIARVSLHNPANVRKARKAIELAFRAPMAGLGLGLVEVLSMCPINWKVEPVQSLDWMVKNMIPQFPLGEFKCLPEVAEMKKVVKG
ncbi:MAG: thiamine pyrophosphate-dependent enzyme [Chloroflexi bacterium]|nr:thiamine pyrophosphate-dependent enzyme [Chloroflexota bacterium]